MSKDKKIIEGRVLSFDKNPFDKDFDLSSLKIQRKRIFVIDGIINSIEEANFSRSDFNDIEVMDYGEHLISAGFVDAHVHYPQTAIIASWGKRLIDWLNVYTFPEEMKFNDLNYASEIANRYLNFLYLMAPQPLQVTARSTQKVLMSFLKLQRPTTCVSWREKHVWIGMRQKAYAIRQNLHMMTVKRFLRLGIKKVEHIMQ